MANVEQKKKSRSEEITVDKVALQHGLVPPQALDLEEAVLAAMIVDSYALEQVLEELPSSQIFYSPRNRLIYEAILALKADRGSAVDIYTVVEKLQSQGNLDAVGGAGVIADLSNKIAASAHLDAHLRRLKEKFIQRELMTAAGKILIDSSDENANIDELVLNSQQSVYDAVQINVKKDVEVVGSVLARVYAHLEEMQDKTGIQGVESGLAGLDKVTLGFQPSDLIILAARPSVGKTALALNIARNAAVTYHKPVAFFSLEMSSEQLVQRLMLTETRMPSAKLKGGQKLTEQEWQGINHLLTDLSEAPLYIDDTASLPINEFAAKVKRLVNEKGVQLVIVDYLQLMQGPKDLKGGVREQEVAAISRTLKATAKENKIPIIALSQLSRQTMQRATSNNRPQLNDLRESGSIEQDADMVLFIHRQDYQNASGVSDSEAKTTLIIAKHRNGEVKDVDLIFKKNYSLFVDDESSFVPGGSTMESSDGSSISSAAFNDVDRGY